MIQTSSTFRQDPLDDGSISLSEVISALSFALDLTEGAVHGHALRTCLLGMRIAEEAQLPSDLRSSLYYALLLKDIGCSNNASRMCEIVGGDDRAVKAGVKYEDWTKPHKPSLSTLRLLWKNVLPDAGPAAKVARIIRIGASQHKNNEEMITLRCDRGASIVTKLGMGRIAAEAVRSLDEHWDGGGYPERAKRERIPLLARICAVAQHLDVFFTGRGAEAAIQTLQQRSGTWFDPDLVRAAISLHRRDALWEHCSASESPEETRKAALDLDPARRQHLGATQIDLICEAFAEVVDAKSHFTFCHSMGVADAALGIAQHIGLSPERVQLVRRAALLHDIGKLSVSNTILDKQGKLTENEWKAVYKHPGLTRRILERVGPLREIAVVAGEHHEKLDGTGYPDRLMAQDLTLESRIIAVADVYGSLSEDRPYRAALGLDQIVAIMSELTPHKLDPDCLEVLISVVSGQRGVAAMPAAHPRVQTARLAETYSIGPAEWAV
jgi:putative nucleotidyltransferase with HDIG domain